MATRDEPFAKDDLIESMAVSHETNSIVVDLKLNSYYFPILIVVLAPKSTYRVCIFIEHQRHTLIPATAVINTVSGINVVSKEVDDHTCW